MPRLVRLPDDVTVLIELPPWRVTRNVLNSVTSTTDSWSRYHSFVFPRMEIWNWGTCTRVVGSHITFFSSTTFRREISYHLLQLQQSWSIFNMQGRVHQGPGLRKTATLNKSVEQEALYLQPRRISRIWCYLEETKGHTSGNSSGSLSDLWCDVGSYQPVLSSLITTETFDYRLNTYCDKSSEESRWFFVIFLLHFRIFLLLEMMMKAV